MKSVYANVINLFPKDKNYLSDNDNEYVVNNDNIFIDGYLIDNDNYNKMSTSSQILYIHLLFRCKELYNSYENKMKITYSYSQCKMKLTPKSFYKHLRELETNKFIIIHDTKIGKSNIIEMCDDWILV